MFKVRASGQSRECPCPSGLGISPLFSSIRGQSLHGVYIPHLPWERSHHLNLICIATIFLSSAYILKPSKSLAFSTSYRPSCSDRQCPGGTIIPTVLTHLPHHLHLRPAQPIEPTSARSLRPATANYVASASLHESRDHADEAPVAQEKPSPRAQWICQSTITVFERPRLHRFWAP